MAKVIIPETREGRGIELYRERGEEIVIHPDGSFECPSRTNPDVTYHGSLESETCDCPDYTIRNLNCLHIAAATIKRAKLTSEAERRSEEMRRRSRERRAGRVMFSSDQVMANLDRMAAS